MHAKGRQQAELKTYQLNSLYTMKAQQYAWANSVIKALMRGHAARAAVSRERHGEQVVAAIPKAKGVQRYRALAKSKKPTAAEVVKNWASELPGSTKRVIPHNITMDGQLQQMATARMSAWDVESGTTADFEKHMDTKCTERTQPGEQGNPIQCFSDSDSSRTTLRDGERTDTDADLTVSEDGALLQEETSQAMQIISASRARQEQTADDGGWDVATVPHACEFKTALLCLAQTIDPNMALQQVDARFPTESQISWEARGAAVKGHFWDYSAAMKARFNSPNQDDWEWKQFGRSYTQLLALLKLDVKLLQDIWPQASGGEAAYRRHWKLQVKHWTRSAQKGSTLIA